MLASEAIDRTLSEWLWPAGVDRAPVDILSSSMTAGAPAAGATFTVQGIVQNIPPSSIIEVGSELILTQNFVGTTGTVAERGWLDSVAASHSIGDQIRVDPKYPRKTLLHHVASIVGMLEPWGLYVRGFDDTQTFSVREVKTLPSGARRILSIAVRSTGSLENYDELTMEGRDWLLHRQFEPPKYLVRRGGGEGADMRVVYAKAFGVPAAETDDLDTIGVPSTLQPYLPLGVAGFALQGKEIPRVQIEEIRRMLAAQGVQVGSALNVGQAMLRAFRFEYVMAERARQREADPVRFAWVRGQ
jgi:hypothetical protein